MCPLALEQKLPPADKKRAARSRLGVSSRQRGSRCRGNARNFERARRAERSPQLAGRLGAAECLGVFHCTSESDFDRAAAPGAMAAALAAVSAPAEDVWADVVGALESKM